MNDCSIIIEEGDKGWIVVNMERERERERTKESDNSLRKTK